MFSIIVEEAGPNTVARKETVMKNGQQVFLLSLPIIVTSYSFQNHPFKFKVVYVTVPKVAWSNLSPFSVAFIVPVCALCAFPAGCAKTEEPARHRHGGYNTPSNPPLLLPNNNNNNNTTTTYTATIATTT